MTITASEMGKKSAAARRQKRGGKKGFAKHMRKIAQLPRKKLSPPAPLDS
jgi:hypothetical protein